MELKHECILSPIESPVFAREHGRGDRARSAEITRGKSAGRPTHSPFGKLRYAIGADYARATSYVRLVAARLPY
ncbi:hypothetical protein DPMN_068885 [Dreissena polymorpha]|uniref:Uncharacterized protein n=1 Tax=Dreissena polymorpha TaxID=45954 RepID=A0A9D3Z328_DREPO|nr:hypothetical protein DPMN_068885 [Dreissena polymorpha]